MNLLLYSCARRRVGGKMCILCFFPACLIPPPPLCTLIGPRKTTGAFPRIRSEREIRATR